MEVHVPILNSLFNKDAYLTIGQYEVIIHDGQRIITLAGLTASGLATLKDGLQRVNNYPISVGRAFSGFWKNLPPSDKIATIHHSSGGGYDRLIVDYEALISAAKQVLEAPTEATTDTPPTTTS